MSRVSPLYTDEEIEVGKPIKASFFANIKSNDTDHQDRLLDLESNLVYVPIFNSTITGELYLINTTEYSSINHYSLTELSNIASFKNYGSFTITLGTLELRLLDGSSLGGTLEITLQTSTDLINWTDIDSVSTASDAEGASDTADLSAHTCGVNDWLRLNVTSLKTKQSNFHVSLNGTRV